MTRLIRLGGAVMLATLTACTGAAVSQKVLPPSPGERLLLSTTSAFITLGMGPEESYAIPRPAVVVANRGPAISSSHDGTSTRIYSHDLGEQTSREIAVVDGHMEVVIASQDGGLAALAPPRPDAPGPVVEGRAQTEIAIVDQTNGGVSRLDLAGNFEPEAFSLDGSQVFLIEHLPPLVPDGYRVSRLDLANSTMMPIGAGFKQPPPEKMEGTGRTSLLSPDGKLLYTLYTRQVQSYPHGRPAELDPHADSPIHAFIHVLNLEKGWTHCVDLPHPFGSSPFTGITLAIGSGGSQVLVIDRDAGRVAAVDSKSLEITRVAEVPSLRSGSIVASGVDAGGRLYAGVGREVVAFDGRSFEAAGRFDAGAPIRALALDPNGQRLYLGLNDRIRIVDPATQRVFGEIAAGNFDDLVSVISPAG